MGTSKAAERVAIFSVAMLFLLSVLASSLLVAVSQASAAPIAEDPAPPTAPSVDCEWYGSLGHDSLTDFAWAYEGSSTHQVIRNVTKYSSAPVDGEVCGANWSATSAMHFIGLSPDICGGTITITDNQVFGGSGTGYLSGGLSMLGLDGLVAGFSGGTQQAMTGTVDQFNSGTCLGGSTSRNFAETKTVPSVSSVCPHDYTLPSNYFVEETAQAVAGTCTRDATNSENGYTTRHVDTVTWSFRKNQCDFNIDTDGGGVSDCQEFANGTDPGDGDDDTDNKDTDGDGRSDQDEGKTGDGSGTDTDGDGAPDYMDTDSDNDGAPDSSEGDGDKDSDGIPDWRDPDDGAVPDADKDTIPDEIDNCPNFMSLDQSDIDEDGVGDVCESDFIAADDELKVLTNKQEVTIDLGATNVGIDQVSGVFPSNTFPGNGGSYRIEGAKIIWTLPEGADTSRPLLGTYRLAYEAKAFSGDRDIANLTVTLYDCADLSAVAGQGDVSIKWDPSFCFDGADTWFENLEAGTAKGITANTHVGAIGGVLGFSSHWTQGPTTTMGDADTVEVQQGLTDNIHFVEGTAQFCFQPTGIIAQLSKRLLKNHLAAFLAGQGLQLGAQQLNQIVKSIANAGRGCADYSTARMDFIAMPSGDYSMKVRYDDDRSGKRVDETFYATHTRTPTRSGIGYNSYFSEQARSRRDYIEATWKCSVYNPVCQPTVKPRR